MPKFKTMRERVEYAYDALNVDIYYEGNLLYTILDHACEQFIEFLTEEQLDCELEKIWSNRHLNKSLTGSGI